MPTDLYRARIAACERELAALDARFTRCSWLRAAAALAALVFFILGLEWNGWAGFPLCLLAVAAFVLLVRRHDRIERRQRAARAMKQTAQDYLARMDDGWKAFPITGKGYLTPDFPQGRDLDIFGRESLYQFLCAAHTVYGRDRLASFLKDGCPPEELSARQRAVEELAGKPEFSLKLQALGRDMAAGRAKEDAQAIAAFLEVCKIPCRPSKIGTVLSWALPFAALFFLLSALVGMNPPLNLTIGGGLVVLQLLAALARFSATGRVLNPLFRFGASVAPYAALIALIEEEPFESPGLAALRERIRRDGGAAKALASLAHIGEAVKMRHNFMAFILYNGLFLWDFHCVRRFASWQKAHAADMPVWLENIGELEALTSLAVLCQTRRTVFPDVTEDAAPTLSFADLRHPLIPADKAVGNDFRLSRRTCVVTGSNMSGKTTFLRTIGVNLLLAYAGGPVLASQLRVSRMRVMTCMRTEDSVSQGISTFYAELLRVKSIVDAADDGRPLLALIDEIYKGTNSRDRILGATETIRRLAAPHVMTLVTTHDFELCALENDPTADAVNYHFTERYAGDEILFDYTIHPGRCTTTNARHLLRLAGILPAEPPVSPPDR